MENNNISKEILPISPEDRSLSTLGNFAIWFAGSMVVTVVLTGMYFIPGLDLTTALLLVLVGSLFGIMPLIGIGIIGSKTGCTTMVAARATFGIKGANLPSLVSGAIFIGWQWAQAALGGLALNYISSTYFGYSNLILFTILTEIIVVVIALNAIKGIALYEKIAMIVIGLIMVTVIAKAFMDAGIGNLLSVEQAPEEARSYMSVFDLVVASALSWVPMAADYNRNCKNVKSVVIGTGGGYIAGTFLAMGAGAIMICMLISTGKEAIYDPAQAFSEVGLGIPGAIAILMSVIAANVMCMYSSTVAIVNAFPKLPYKPTALVVGIVCIVGGAFSGILDMFLAFVNIIAVLFMPMFAIMIADFFIIKKQKVVEEALFYPEKNKAYVYFRGINFVAVITFLVSMALCYFWTYISPIATGATIPTFFITFALYIILTKIFTKK